MYVSRLRFSLAPSAVYRSVVAAASKPCSSQISSKLCKAASGYHNEQQQGQRRFLHVEKRIKELGIELPPPAGPRANYDVICHDEDANIMYISGHLPFRKDGSLMTGKITGKDGFDVEYGYDAARHAALNIVSTLSARLDGNLDRIEKIQKIFGIVQSSDDFKEHHLVMNGASDVLMQIFGDEVGYHARSAIGTSTLPLDISVEVEAIVKLKPE